VIDCHFHVWTQDESTPEKRAERAEQLIGEMDAHGVDRLCLIGETGTTIEECRAGNETVAEYVAAYPDRFYGWARVDPRLGEAAVTEFQRAVEEDGLIGLKHHFMPTPVNVSDPEFFPLAEAAVGMDVPIIAHVMQRLPADQEDWDDSEAHTEDVLALAQRYPDLKLISAHVLAGGDAEYRIKNVADQSNVHLDIAGSNPEAGMIELAADRLGVDRLVFGTDTWFAPGVGKLDGVDLPPAEKTTIAYNLETLLGEDVPNRYDAATLAEKRERTRERFAAVAEPRAESITVANAFVGHWSFRRLDASAADLLSLLDRNGIDRALVSAFESVLYRNVHAGNRELARRVAGHEDRLVPVATIDPTYAAWEDDLRECVEELGMVAVKMLPTYHDYDLDSAAARDLLDACAALDVPAIVCATLEDRRQRHPRVTLRGFEDGGTRAFTDEHVDDLVGLLTDCPGTDVVLADLWSAAPRVYEACCETTKDGVRLDNAVRSGETLFVLDDLYVYFTHQARAIVEDVGAENLVVGPKLPLKSFEATYTYTEMLPVSDAEKEGVRSDNLGAIVA